MNCVETPALAFSKGVAVTPSLRWVRSFVLLVPASVKKQFVTESLLCLFVCFLTKHACYINRKIR